MRTVDRAQRVLDRITAALIIALVLLMLAMAIGCSSPIAATQTPVSPPTAQSLPGVVISGPIPPPEQAPRPDPLPPIVPPPMPPRTDPPPPTVTPRPNPPPAQKPSVTLTWAITGGPDTITTLWPVTLGFSLSEAPGPITSVTYDFGDGTAQTIEASYTRTLTTSHWYAKGTRTASVTVVGDGWSVSDHEIVRIQ